jgi:hypothetical protein
LDGTSFLEELIPILKIEADGKPNLKFAIPVITPVSRLVKIGWLYVPVSNIHKYSGAVIINPVDGSAKLYSPSEIQQDATLKNTRLFPVDFATEVAKSSRFAGINDFFGIVKAIAPSWAFSDGSFDIAAPVGKAKWPSLYAGDDNSVNYFYPKKPSQGKSLWVREVSVDADSGKVTVEVKNPPIADANYIIETPLKQVLNTNGILTSAFGQFDEPGIFQIKNDRFYAYPITTQNGAKVLVYAVTSGLISSDGSIAFQFFSSSDDLLKWANNPVFTNQNNLKEIFALNGKSASSLPVTPVVAPTATSSISKEDFDRLVVQLNRIEEKLNKLAPVPAATAK